ncbi:hypothetical protein [Candidatus Uabimicrobium amorphum]|uniref:DUF3592 domain-containing protein n=1 Tax=Uabimicrobium amorphum TaxID=2596890 RepID=A0A5S9F7I8_UABAM|nr:hypothetical protein [Candidatus Uabimicrobium amorphum]BBM87759.1 hypothetical protein UABAM_06174 [Candidatus Uabimicrobium amorphum]
MQKCKKIFQTMLLIVGIGAFLMMFVLFFYTQNNARTLYRFKEHGKKITATVVEKSCNSFLGYKTYTVAVKYKKQTRHITRFISEKTYNTLHLNSTTEILQNSENTETILFASTDKKNLKITDKKTIVYILLLIGFVCFVTHSILGNLGHDR